MLNQSTHVERREFDGFEMAPRSLPMNHFGLEEPDDRFRQGIVVRIASTAHRWLDRGLGQPLVYRIDRYCVPRSL